MTKLAGGLVSHPLVNLLGGQLKLDYLLFVWEFSTKKYRAELGMTRAIQKHPFWELLSWPNLFMAGDCSRRTTIFGAPSPPTTAYCLRALDVNNTSPPCQFPTNIIYWRIVIHSIIVTIIVIVDVAASCRCNRHRC